jgi:hypothetical protein
VASAAVGIKLPLDRRKAFNQSAQIVLVVVFETLATSAETERITVCPVGHYIHSEFVGKVE